MRHLGIADICLFHSEKLFFRNLSLFILDITHSSRFVRTLFTTRLSAPFISLLRTGSLPWYMTQEKCLSFPCKTHAHSILLLFFHLPSSSRCCAQTTPVGLFFRLPITACAVHERTWRSIYLLFAAKTFSVFPHSCLCSSVVCVRAGNFPCKRHVFLSREKFIQQNNPAVNANLIWLIQTGSVHTHETVSSFLSRLIDVNV